jgi:hypothetical protein
MIIDTNPSGGGATVHNACANQGYRYAIRDFSGGIGALHNDYSDREGDLVPESAGNRRTFLRFSFWANLLLRRFLSPGFRKNACFLASLIMPSCCTCRLNRRRALSIDSPSKIRIAANAGLQLSLKMGLIEGLYATEIHSV